jgi:hypothetical protein
MSMAKIKLTTATALPTTASKARTSMFALWYRFDNNGDFARLPYIFCCRGFNEQNVFTYIKLITRNAGATLYRR